VPDEGHNLDGSHIRYLDAHTPLARSLQQCDPVLFTKLRELVSSKRRSVRWIEAADVLPASSITFADIVPRRLNDPAAAALSARDRWLRRAAAVTEPCNVVFFDPDNGLAPTRQSKTSKNAHKYIFLDELSPFTERDQTVVVYQHADRSADVVTQVNRKMALIAEQLGVDPLGAIRSRRGSCRLFLVVPSVSHRPQLEVSVQRFARDTAWSRHVSFMPFGR